MQSINGIPIVDSNIDDSFMEIDRKYFEDNPSAKYFVRDITDGEIKEFSHDLLSDVYKHFDSKIMVIQAKPGMRFRFVIPENINKQWFYRKVIKTKMNAKGLSLEELIKAINKE